MKKHLLITGTGRTGTTFLMRLFSRLGLETGFPFDAPVNAKANAGFELPIGRLMDWMGKPACPRIIKNPALCDVLDEMLARKQFAVEYVLLPVRDLFAAAESRRRVQALSPAVPPGMPVPGGLISSGRQEVALARRVHNVILAIARYDLPHILLDFPRLATDAQYLFERIGFLEGIGTWEQFRVAFAETSRPELIHTFSRGTQPFADSASRPSKSAGPG